MAFVVFGFVIVVAIFGPGLWVRHVIEKYSVPEDRYNKTGSAIARYLLAEHGLDKVRVESSSSGDHYDPDKKAVRLTPEKFAGRSLTAIVVAAHEVGHAVQDAEKYAPLRIRTRMVRAGRGVEKLGAAALLISPFIGAVTRAPMLGMVFFSIGFLTLASSALVHLVTLPTEFDASFTRALPMLDKYKILKSGDRRHAYRLLQAAALTYVAASLMSLLNIARWLAILRR